MAAAARPRSRCRLMRKRPAFDEPVRRVGDAGRRDTARAACGGSAGEHGVLDRRRRRAARRRAATTRPSTRIAAGRAGDEQQIAGAPRHQLAQPGVEPGAVGPAGRRRRPRRRDRRPARRRVRRRRAGVAWRRPSCSSRISASRVLGLVHGSPSVPRSCRPARRPAVALHCSTGQRSDAASAPTGSPLPHAPCALASLARRRAPAPHRSRSLAQTVTRFAFVTTAGAALADGLHGPARPRRGPQHGADARRTRTAWSSIG